MSVAIFTKHLNEVIVPRHANMRSELVDPRNGQTLHVSHTVGWRLLQKLGLRYGSSLKKGVIQDHERPDVVAARTIFVRTWKSTEKEMHCWRQVDVKAAKEFLTKHTSACSKTTVEDMIGSLKLEKLCMTL